MKNTKNLIFILLLLFSAGCAPSISQFQSGKILEPGEVSLGYSKVYGISVSEQSDDNIESNIGISGGPEYWLQAGIKENYDIGAKLSLPASHSLFIRRGFLNETKGDLISIATGLGYASSQYEYTYNDVDKEAGTTDISIPGYFSKDFLEDYFRVYAIPTLNYRTKSVNNTETNEKDSNQYLMVGGTIGAGINLFDMLHIMYERNELRDVENTDYGQSQSGWGVFLDINF
ncbi:MAG: hypothetical protein ACQEQC_08570 [Elusimicrobiota bacterium]